MIRVLFHGKPVLVALTRESAEQYIAQHSPEMQAKMTVKETRA